MAKKKYVDTFVDLKYLATLKNEMDNEKSPKKYSKYKAWLHYANLKSWQEQGWHWGYINFNDQELHCTCGLAVPKDDKSDLKPEVLQKLLKLDLDIVQLQGGHRKLPSLSGSTNVLLVNFHWIENQRSYYWDLICQWCGEFSQRQGQGEIKKFNMIHNHPELKSKY